MTNNPTDSEKLEVERIEKWRAERATVAGAAKQERVKQAEADKAVRLEKAAKGRKEQLAKEDAERAAQAAALLPNPSELDEIRRALSREQRHRRLVNLVQAIIFVMLPTLATAWYVTFVAVPLYEAKSVVTITTPGGQQDSGLPGMLGGMISQGSMGEAFMAHEFINSHEMMQLMEDEEGLLRYYSSLDMDPLQRLRNIPALQIGAITYYRHFIRVSVNIQTGLLTLYVSARTPEDAKHFSVAILHRAEIQIRALSRALFEEQISENEAAVNRTRETLEDARRNLIQLQISSGYANPRESVAEVHHAISALEGELSNLQGQIDDTALSGYSDSRQMQQLIETKQTLENRVAQHRLRLVRSDQGKSLNQVLADYEFALVQQELAKQTWSTALVALDHTRSTAALGLSQFQVVVPPNASLVSARPNRIKTTLFVFLIFFGMFGAYKVFRPKVS